MISLKIQNFVILAIRKIFKGVLHRNASSYKEKTTLIIFYVETPCLRKSESAIVHNWQQRLILYFALHDIFF